MEISGGSRDQPTGRSMRVTQGILERLGGSVVPASFCRLIRPTDTDIGFFISEYLKNLYDEGGTWRYQNQSTGISNFQFRYFAEQELIAVPDSTRVIGRFAQIMAALSDKIDAHQLESRTLVAFRDALLPKLISGEIRIQKSERAMQDGVVLA